MPLAAGTSLGPYEILSPLGSGGMGEVYKARDKRLGREVAVKVLRAERVADPERKRRFIHEARAASSLNHPNIVAIYDIGVEDGLDYIVMEYVAGRTLEQMIPAKGMRFQEALRCAVQMADALAKAHAAGITHRDFKPGNVMVTAEGVVKVLDFGLAKLVEKGESGEFGATETLAPKTEEGTILGTVSYMSPEQAEGKPVDARSDIFSFGAVLYEMLTGQRAFLGDSRMSTLAAILDREPPAVGGLRQGLPHELEKTVHRALRKELARRSQNMLDIKLALEEMKEESDSGLPAAAGAAPAAARPRTLWWWVAVSSGIGVAALALSGWLLWRGSETAPGVPLIAVPLTTDPGSETDPTFSPDGNQVAYAWNGPRQDNLDIWVKVIGAGEPLRLTTDPAPDRNPAWSPDGRFIAFVRIIDETKRAVIVVPALGGRERKLCDLTRLPLPHTDTSRTPSWSRDGRRLVTSDLRHAGSTAELVVISAETGEKRVLATPPAGTSGYSSPSLSPDNSRLAFNLMRSWGVNEVWVLDLAEGLTPRGAPRKLAVAGGRESMPVWMPDGRRVIYANLQSGQAGLWQAPADGSGAAAPLGPVGQGGIQAAISGSRQRLVYTVGISDSNIWQVPIETGGRAGQPTPLVASTSSDDNAQFAPDGKRITFASTRSGNFQIWVCDADGSNAIQVTSMKAPVAASPRWSPDGAELAFDSNPDGHYDLYAINANGGAPRRLTTEPTLDAAPRWSRDGKWIYFGSDRTGREEVWKVPAAGGAAIQVTRQGGFAAEESADGTTLYYTRSQGSSELWSAPAQGGEETRVLPLVISRGFTVSEKGIWFLSRPGPQAPVTLNWLDLPAGTVRTLASIPRLVSQGLSASPDGKRLIYTQVDRAGSDLMLVEGFR